MGEGKFSQTLFFLEAISRFSHSLFSEFRRRAKPAAAETQKMSSNKRCNRARKPSFLSKSVKIHKSSYKISNTNC